MRSKFELFGHPLHPMLVSLPIGLFVWSLIAIVIHAASDETMTWYEISRYTGAAAVAVALIAALPGFADLLTIAWQSNARVFALLHMAGNLTAVALFAVSVLLMANDSGAGGDRLVAVIVLQAIGLGAITVAGYLGGHLVYRYHLGIVPDDAELEIAERSHHLVETH